MQLDNIGSIKASCAVAYGQLEESQKRIEEAGLKLMKAHNPPMQTLDELHDHIVSRCDDDKKSILRLLKLFNISTRGFPKAPHVLVFVLLR
jgi:hypothetical protein